MSESKGVFPRFFIDPREDKPASKEAGRPIFKDVEYVEVIIAGDKNNRPVMKVNDQHRARWPEQYAKFKAGQQQGHDGTPVEQWPQITRAKAEELKALGVFTVEALAELPDSVIHRLGMGARELIGKAKGYLQSAEDTAGITALAGRVEKLEAENQLLRESVGNEKLIEENEALKTEIEKLKAPKPKRKRRTKAEIEADKAKAA